MDTSAYLKRHGWRGDGHSLDTTNRGISRPLLVSKKVDVLGIGLNKHAAVSDQWWMRAFDEGLKNLGSGNKSTLANVREKGVHFGGLYGRFVKGETVQGTIESEEDKAKKVAASASSKRKREDDSDLTVKSSKRKAIGIDTAAGEKLAKRVTSQTKAVVCEAVRRGLIPKGSKDGGTTSSSKSPKVDESTLLYIFDQAGLKDVPAFGEESSKSDRKQTKHIREKLQRDLKRVARAQFISKLSSADQALVKQVAEAKEMERASRGELKHVEKYNLAAQKAIEKASKSARRKARSDKKDADSAGVSEKASRYAERAAAKGVSVEDYTRRRAEKNLAKRFQPSASGEATVDFVVDTCGDPGPEMQAMLDPTPTVAPSSLNVVDKEGNIRYTVIPGTSVPLDPSIWTGVDVKSLPKPVRQARRQWMAASRTERKSPVQTNGDTGSKKYHKTKVAT